MKMQRTHWHTATLVVGWLVSFGALAISGGGGGGQHQHRRP